MTADASSDPGTISIGVRQQVTRMAVHVVTVDVLAE